MSPKEISEILGVSEETIINKYIELFPEEKCPLHNIKISCKEATLIKKSLPQTERIKNVQTDCEMMERVEQTIELLKKQNLR